MFFQDKGLLPTRYILENGKGISSQDCNAEGKSPLHEAAQVRQLECVKILIQYGSDVNALKRGDWTPLMLACTKVDNLQVVKVLVENGANKKLKNKDGWTAFHLAAREGDENIARFLMSTDRFIWRTSSNNGRTPLHTIALHGHKTLAMLLYGAENLDVDVEDHCGITPLHDALRANNIDTAKFIISKGAHWDKRDKLGRHALHLAAEAGAEASVGFLIEDLKIPANILSNCGSTPLHFSAKEGEVDIVKYLIQHGADIIRDNQGRTATDLAADRGYKQVVTLLTKERERNA
ncbi:ankyrin repeat domain-containing protein 16-like isoform X2 [Artemia franciscana]|uniref:ankyrin repeat domain-containing protein 16-like isoform X2 n=1 Tax=Artemia franciscana TaxID=6661 RepID=UPI0032DB918E